MESKNLCEALGLQEVLLRIQGPTAFLCTSDVCRRKFCPEVTTRAGLYILRPSPGVKCEWPAPPRRPEQAHVVVYFGFHLGSVVVEGSMTTSPRRRVPWRNSKA